METDINIIRAYNMYNQMKYFIYILFFLPYVSNFVFYPNNLQLRKNNFRKNMVLSLSAKLNNDYSDDNESFYKYYNIKPLVVKPIEKINYDDIFYNRNSIQHAFLSSNLDRIVIFYNQTKGVYYFENDSDLVGIDFILKSNNVNMKLIKDYKREMDSKDGVLYCAPKNKTNENRGITKPVLVEPIKCIVFDDILYNMKNISHVYLSGNYDRVVVFFNDTKGVYYFNDDNDLDRIEYMMKLNNIKIQIIHDYKRIMDTYNGILYCSKNVNEEDLSDEEELFDIADYIDTDYTDDNGEINITYIDYVKDYLEDIYNIDEDDDCE